MDYTLKNIDILKFEDGLRDNRDHQQWMLRIAEEKAQAFFAGYVKALTDVQSMLHCSNYEGKE